MIAANAYIQTIVTQGIALVSSAAATAAAERAVLTALAKKFIKSAPKATASRRLLQSFSSTGAVDLTNSTVVADLLTQAIATAQASGDITAAAAASAQTSVLVVAAAVANVNTAVRCRARLSCRDLRAPQSC